ncbi:GNAT family N-acetyltransferase [Maribacter sp. HTCC2170]|uniref:GNAT family N-acetyltransferase n=1 Tax=Maribacter sp. (strain HTCC2170 / KCCM 42371) TaxID=313603 RepID=UPI00006AFC75|nr:GNAT family N-acetyltransferase [Maribacter sp. HTCC2170]EAR01231.1 acetyltransferase [Maribacter sp. HTCC2170]
MNRKVYISTEKEKLDTNKIQAYISNISYWGRGRTLEEVETTIKNSICFGMYDSLDEQIAFARVVTDQLFFGYIMDVIVFEEYQGQGCGKDLVEHIMNHEVVSRLKTIALKTKDAQEFYRKFDFKSIGDSELWMANDKLILL